GSRAPDDRPARALQRPDPQPEREGGQRGGRSEGEEQARSCHRPLRRPTTFTAMSSVTTASAVPHGTFVRSRLGSFLAVVPLGVWTILHLWNNLAAFQGEAAWQSAVTEYPHPLAQLVGFVIVLLPLVLHTIWGLQRLLTARPNNQRYGFYNNLKYL